MKIETGKTLRVLACYAVVASATVLSSVTPALSTSLVPGYMVIANAPGGQGDAFHSHDGEMGAIDYVPGRASNPSNPKGVSAGYKSPVSGVIGLDGDIAVTSTSGKISLERTDIHSSDTGYANQGIDCASSYATCTPSELKDNRYNTVVPGDNFTGVANNNGVQGSIDHTQLLSDLASASSDYWNNAITTQTEILDLSSDGKITSGGDSSNFYDTSYGSGLNVVDIDTGGNDFDISNVTWRIDGDADTKVIFRVNAEANMKLSNANIYISDDMTDDSVLFLVDGKQGTVSIDLSNTFFWGISFWDYQGLASDNYANFSNVQGCGQVVSDRVNFNNVSMDGCSFNPTLTVVPLPAAFPLFGAALLGLGFLGWKRRKA